MYKSAQKNPELFKKNYKKSVLESLSKAQVNIPKSIDFYINNVKMSSKYAKSKDVEVLLVQQPIIFNVNKKLSLKEKDIVKHSKLSFFALTNEELNNLKSIPTHQIKKNYFWNFEYYKSSYNRQKKELRNLSKDLNIYFHDLDEDLAEYDEIPLFTSVVHYTFHGSEAIAKSLSHKVLSILN